MKLEDNSVIDIILKNILKIYKLNRNTVKEFDYLTDLMYRDMEPVLYREFNYIIYMNSFLEEKQRLESDYNNYINEYKKFKDFIDKYVKEANNKDKIILYLSTSYASIIEYNSYKAQYNILDILNPGIDIRPYIKELKENDK